MDYVYLIWEEVDGWPTYLVSIYANKEDADKECERLNDKNRSSKTFSYFVDKGVVK